MIALKIQHATPYRYHQSVSLGPYRLMLLPRESRDLRLISSELRLTPAADVTWAYDVFGNYPYRHTEDVEITSHPTLVRYRAP